MTPNRVHRFVSNDFTLRAAVVDATAVVQEMHKLQQTMPLPTVAVGRAMVGAILMASQLKEGQQVGLYFKGYGELVAVYAEASFEGGVRGYTPVPLYVPANYDQGLSLKGAFGGGTLTVSRHQPFQKQPFQGTVSLVSGEIGEDIAHYLHQSHQIRSIVSLGVYLDTFGQVKAAGGIIIEVMPGVEEDIVEKVQKNSEAQKESVSQMILNGAQPTDIIKPYFAGIPFTELDHNYPISYHCPCTRERVINAMEMLGLEDLDDMLKKKEEADATCQMCGRPYKITLDEMQDLRDRMYRNSLN